MDTLGRADQLFSKPLLVNVYEGGSSSFSRKLKLLINIEWFSATSGNLRRELVIRLTDENEPFFIYNLHLCEEDFQSLKNQQGLLVDFLAFPQKFINLLELCEKEEVRDVPKFVLNLCVNGRLGVDGGAATLDVVETNPFKLLTHLSLKLVPATDAFIKKFLASNIKSVKEENRQLELNLRSTQNDLQARLQACQQELSSRTQEWDQKYRQMQSEMCALSQRHQTQLKEEQERIMQIHRDAETRWTLEKQELEQKLSRETLNSETRDSLLGATNKDLQDRLQKTEATLREVRSHLVNVQSENQETLTRFSSVNREVQALTVQNQEHLKVNGNLRVQLSQAQQEVRDREIKQAASQELLNTTQQQKLHLENLCEQRQTIISKKETALKTVSEELKKGNEIIRKLQAEIRNYHTKLKQRNHIACKQEEILTEKEALLLRVQADISQFQERLKASEEENVMLNAELRELKKKFEENQKQIKSNENVISWLNKQLNDVQLGTARGGGGGPPLYDSSVLPATRMPHQMTGMATSTPMYRPSVISPTAHPMYRAPVLPLNNITPKPLYNPFPAVNGAHKSPLTHVPNKPEAQGTISSVISKPSTDSGNTEPKVITAVPEPAKRPQSSDAAKGKAKPKVTRQISSAPTRK